MSGSQLTLISELKGQEIHDTYDCFVFFLGAVHNKFGATNTYLNPILDFGALELVAKSNSQHFDQKSDALPIALSRIANNRLCL